MDSKTIDLGSCVVRMNNSMVKYHSLNLLEFLTPPEYDQNGCFVRDSQFVCIQGNDTIESFRDALNELWPPINLTNKYVDLRQEYEKQREIYHKMNQELIKINGENTYLKGMMKDMELKKDCDLKENKCA
jgi:hypothetical protein